MGAIDTYLTMIVVFIVSYGVIKLFGMWWESGLDSINRSKGWDKKEDKE